MMIVDVRCNGIQPTDALRQYAERRINFALGRFPRVERATLRLFDINGDHGGVDKACRIALLLRGGGDLVVEHIDRDLYVAIDRAADRAGRAVAREHRRSRDSWRRFSNRSWANLPASS